MLDISKFTPLWGVWEIESTIGEGSFGKVYKAVRKEFGRTYCCAIKHISLPQSEAEIKQLMDEQLSDDRSIASDYYKQIVEDISNEIAIMHTLRGNTNVVAYEDHMIRPKEDGVGYDIFIRMELLTELPAKLKESVFTQTNAIKLGVDICTALEICAARDLIHRDIKPQNIFISEDGHYKLGDFSIARRLEKTTSGLSKKGTYSYMAPEVYKGQDYGANVDIYSLGILLYRLMNGNRLPFLPLAPNPVRYDDNEKALTKRINGESLPAPAFADETLTKIILKMCSFDRNERYKTAGELKQDLLKATESSNKVMPMVAAVGDSSLTGDPTYSSQPLNETDDGTVGMFQDVPFQTETPDTASVSESILAEKSISTSSSTAQQEDTADETVGVFQAPPPPQADEKTVGVFSGVPSAPAQQPIYAPVATGTQPVYQPPQNQGAQQYQTSSAYGQHPQQQNSSGQYATPPGAYNPNTNSYPGQPIYNQYQQQQGLKPMKGHPDKTSKVTGILGLCLSILAIITLFIVPVFGLLAWAGSIPLAIIGIVKYFKAKKYGFKVTPGLVCGIISLVLSALAIFI